MARLLLLLLVAIGRCYLLLYVDRADMNISRSMPSLNICMRLAPDEGVGVLVCSYSDAIVLGVERGTHEDIPCRGTGYQSLIYAAGM